ncbi:MAG: acetyl-CoA carboxylase carboxyltransferase subunit alpha [Acidobacteria bacterium]|nr:MAG: acetyl-CoA carboxylase carboxyltransferase subunit alpha [Acidobacteriota bacterium]
MPKLREQKAIVQDLEKQIAELKLQPGSVPREEVTRLQEQLDLLQRGAEAGNKDAWTRVLLARHPRRPYTLDYIQMLFTEFTELHGDRRFGDDAAIVGGFARFNGQAVMVVGHQKGRDTKQKLHRNFGMTNPEGYRKALRLMELGAKFKLPIITFVDTPGAYPGIGAEERGQAEAIAFNLKEIPKLRVAIVPVIHGEGGSGGALAIAVGDRLLMLENAIYSVIAPESCSSILWRDWDHKEEAARILKMTADDLLALKIIDEIIPEPLHGAHADPQAAAAAIRMALERSLAELGAYSPEELHRRRMERLRTLATFVEES